MTTTDIPPAISLAIPKAGAPGGPQAVTDGHYGGDTQKHSAVGDPTFPPANAVAIPKPVPPGGPNFTSGHAAIDTQSTYAAGESTSGDGQIRSDTQDPIAVPGPLLADNTLGVLAEVVDDLENIRIANENRLRILTTPVDQADKDGQCRGSGLPLSSKPVIRLNAVIEGMKKLEHQAVLDLSLQMRHHPLGAWAKKKPGIGEKQLARLLAVIRDPYWNDGKDPEDGEPYNRPRLVSELWAYCGLHVLHPADHSSSDTHGLRVGGVAPKRVRGQKVDWNQDAKMRIWLIAQSCVQTLHSPYRKVYDLGRIEYAEAVHSGECVRCGPKGKPAQPGSALSDGHKHARAVRLMMKEILKDLWIEAKRLHEAP